MTEKEYNQCVKLYADNVYRFVLKNLGHEADAKDIIQGTFEKMWINREQVDNDRCKSYLFTVAYHQMIDHIRKVKRIHLKEEFSADAKVQDRPANNLKKVLEEALALPVSERADLVERLLSSLDPVEPEVEKRWAKEVWPHRPIRKRSRGRYT